MSEYNMIYPKTFTASSENSLLYKNWNTSTDHIIAREIDNYSIELLELQWLINPDDKVLIIPIFCNNNNYFCPVPFNSTNVEYYFNQGIKIFFYIESNQHEYQFYTSELKELTYNDSSNNLVIFSNSDYDITIDSTGNISYYNKIAPPT